MYVLLITMSSKGVEGNDCAKQNEFIISHSIHVSHIQFIILQNQNCEEFGTHLRNEIWLEFVVVKYQLSLIKLNRIKRCRKILQIYAIC